MRHDPTETQRPAIPVDPIWMLSYTRTKITEFGTQIYLHIDLQIYRSHWSERSCSAETFPDMDMDLYDHTQWLMYSYCWRGSLNSIRFMTRKFFVFAITIAFVVDLFTFCIERVLCMKRELSSIFCKTSIISRWLETVFMFVCVHYVDEIIIVWMSECHSHVSEVDILIVLIIIEVKWTLIIIIIIMLITGSCDAGIVPLFGEYCVCLIVDSVSLIPGHVDSC